MGLLAGVRAGCAEIAAGARSVPRRALGARGDHGGGRQFADLDRLTIFADNVVPHVLRVEGVLRYSEALAARIDRGDPLPPGGEETEI